MTSNNYQFSKWHEEKRNDEPISHMENLSKPELDPLGGSKRIYTNMICS